MAKDELKSIKTKGVTYKYSASWIYSLESESHWRLYWQQQKIMQNLVQPEQHVLEIGVGSGFTANYLRSKGVKVTTIDIDAEKKPDIVANIVEYDFKSNYDHVLGFEVFEHIPFNEFKLLLEKLAGICKEYLFFSVPRNERLWFSCSFKVPKFRNISWEIALPQGKITTPTHFWEVDDGEVTQEKLSQTLNSAGFRLIDREKVLSRLFYTIQSPNKKMDSLIEGTEE